MTTDEILTRWNAATARDRDFWTLEAVVGWRWWAVPMSYPLPYRSLRTIAPPDWTPQKSGYVPSHAEKMRPLDPPNYGGVKPFADADRNVPKVSTSRADVWQVVDAMRRKGWSLNLHCTTSRSATAQLVHPEEPPSASQEESDASKAICLAALLATLRDKP